MAQEELISKKELLQLTGISYGQLYRWKRQHLIPDIWFMKQSSFTGQETFFPKYKILARISVILELKDQYSLEELAQLLSPESADHTYSLEEVRKPLNLSLSVQSASRDVWGKDAFRFTELLFVYLGNELERKIGFTQGELREWLQTSKEWVSQLSKSHKNPLLDQQIIITRKGDVISFLMLKGQGKMYTDCSSEVIHKVDLAERSNEMNLTLQQTVGG